MTEAVCIVCGMPDGAGHLPNCFQTETVNEDNSFNHTIDKQNEFTV